jgi:hypothetical protein
MERLELREGQACETVVPQEVSHDSSQGRCSTNRKGYDLGKISSFVGHKEPEDLHSLMQNEQHPASPGPDSGPDASEHSLPGRGDRRIKGRENGW